MMKKEPTEPALRICHERRYHSLPVSIETYRFDFGSGSYPAWFSPDVKECSQISPIYPHSHPAPEFIEMTEGRLEAALDGEKFTLNAGDILLVSPYATHSAKFDTDNSHGVFEYRYMIFELSVFAGCGKRVADIIDDLRRGKARFRPVISGDSAKALSSLLDEATRHIRRHDATASDDLALTSVLCEILSTALDAGIEKPEMKSRDISFIHNVSSYIELNYKNPLSTAKISSDLGYSVSWFCTAFKRAFGKSFIEYLNEFRVNYAASRYIDSLLSLPEIASAAGFSDYNYFAKRFKKHIGVTPSEFFRK